MTLPVYSTGTVSVSNLGTVVTGAGGMWSGINAREGDIFTRQDGTAIITEVTDANHLVITPWPGATVSGGSYSIQQNYVGRVVGVAAAEDVGVMLEKLHTDGLPFIVGTDETVPDPSYGDDGQFAFQPTTGKWWVKQGGVWVPSSGLTALGYGGTSATSLAIGTGSKVFTTQTGLAYNGARVRAASAGNLNNFMEGVATYSGTTLTMTSGLVSGSGTHADWLFAVAGQQGVQGPQGTTGASGGTFPDAPSDTVLYGRKSATVGGAMAWAAVTGGGGSGFVAGANICINEGNLVSQESGDNPILSGSLAGGPWGYKLTDMCNMNLQGTFQMTAQRSTDAPPGFKYSVKYTVTTAQATMGAADHLHLGIQKIEGQRIAALGFGGAAPQSVALGYWLKSSIANQIVYISIADNPEVLNYCVKYTLTTPGTWYWCATVYPGCTTGTWPIDNTKGMVVFLITGSGSSSFTTPNQWVSGSLLNCGSDVTNMAATNGATLQHSGPFLFAGNALPVAAQTPNLVRSYDDALRFCQRQYWDISSGFAFTPAFFGEAVSATEGLVPVNHPVEMISAPTVVGTGPVTNFRLSTAGGGTQVLTGFPVAFGTPTNRQCVLDCYVASGLVAGNATMLNVTATAGSKIKFDARL